MSYALIIDSDDNIGTGTNTGTYTPILSLVLVVAEHWRLDQDSGPTIGAEDFDDFVWFATAVMRVSGEPLV